MMNVAKSLLPRDHFSGRHVTIAHFHLGKTGGTALNSLMQNVFPGNCRIQQHPDDPPPPNDDSIAYISGHWPPAGYPEILEGQMYCRVILLRYPLFLITSNYRQLVKEEYFGRSEFESALPASISRMVEVLQQWFDGDTNFEHRARRYFDNPQLRFILDKYTGAISESDVEIAIRLLNQIDVVGITEHFGQFHRLLTSRFPKIGEQAVQSVNVSSSISRDYLSLTPDALKYLMSICSHDWQLYHYGLARLRYNIESYTEVAGMPGEEEETIKIAEATLTLPQMFFQSKHAVAGTVKNGFEQRGETILLHPPPVGAPPATLEFESIEFTGERNVHIGARLDNTRSEEVLLSISVWSDERVSFTTTLRLAPGEEKDVSRVATLPLIGYQHVTIESRMVNGASCNAFAWLWVKRLEFS